MRVRGRGHAAGLRDALVLVGVGFGLGLAGALKPAGKDHCPRRSVTWGQCRLLPNHEGDCHPERLP